MKKWIEVKQYFKVIRKDYRNNEDILKLLDDLENVFVELAKEIDYLNSKLKKIESKHTGKK